MALTVFLGDEHYRFALRFSPKHLPFTIRTGFANLAKAFMKAPWIPLALLLGLRRGHASLPRTAGVPVPLLVTCFLTTLAWNTLGACKEYADDNYFLESALVGALFSLAELQHAGAMGRGSLTLLGAT